MIVNCNRKYLFCKILTDNILVKIFLEFFWSRNVRQVYRSKVKFFLVKNALADGDTVVAYMNVP